MKRLNTTDLSTPFIQEEKVACDDSTDKNSRHVHFNVYDSETHTPTHEHHVPTMSGHGGLMSSDSAHVHPVDETSCPHALAGLRMSPECAVGEYVSIQRAREVTPLTIGCGLIRLQYLLLFLIAFLTFGHYWVYDQPGALLCQLQSWFGAPHDTDGSITMFYSVYSIPNTILPFFSGMIIDRITGVRYGAFLFMTLVFVGDFIFSGGIQLRWYWLAVGGRVIYGLGGESLGVAQNTFIVRWFDSTNIAFAFGLVLAFARLGTSVNFVVSPILADMDMGVPISVWFGCGMCLISFIMCCFTGLLDAHGTTTLRKTRAIYIAKLPISAQQYVAEMDVKSEPTNDPIHFSDITAFPIEAWLLFLVCVFFYIGVSTFYTIAQDIITNIGYTDNTADIFISIPSFVSVIACPLFGYLVDKTGRALWWIFGAACVLLLCHTMFILMAFKVSIALWLGPIPAMFLIGVAYSCGAAAIWPILSIIVEPSTLGTGYGMMTAAQNAGLALFPILIAQLRSIDGIKGNVLEFLMPTVVFMVCEGICMIITFILIGRDVLSGGRLNATGIERERMRSEQSARTMNGGTHQTDGETGEDEVIYEYEDESDDIPYVDDLRDDDQLHAFTQTYVNKSIN